MTVKDKLWSESLVKNLRCRGKVVHFLRTSLRLSVDSRNVVGDVYQAAEKPDLFYVANTLRNVENRYTVGV